MLQPVDGPLNPFENIHRHHCRLFDCYSRCGAGQKGHRQSTGSSLQTNVKTTYRLLFETVTEELLSVLLGLQLKSVREIVGFRYPSQ